MMKRAGEKQQRSSMKGGKLSTQSCYWQANQESKEGLPHDEVEQQGEEQQQDGEKQPGQLEQQAESRSQLCYYPNTAQCRGCSCWSRNYPSPQRC